MAERKGSAVKGNGFDPKLTSMFRNELMKRFEALESEKGTYMARCKAIREEIRDIYDRAKDAGIPKREFKDVLDIEKLEKKLAALIDNEDAERAETVEQLRLALGQLNDTPLGEAAAARKDKKPKAEPAGLAPDADAPASTH